MSLEAPYRPKAKAPYPGSQNQIQRIRSDPRGLPEHVGSFALRRAQCPRDSGQHMVYLKAPVEMTLVTSYKVSPVSIRVPLSRFDKIWVV